VAAGHFPLEGMAVGRAGVGEAAVERDRIAFVHRLVGDGRHLYDRVVHLNVYLLSHRVVGPVRRGDDNAITPFLSRNPGEDAGVRIDGGAGGSVLDAVGDLVPRVLVR